MVINPFTAMLVAPSLGEPPTSKTKSAKSETIKTFLPPSNEHVKGFVFKCTVLNVRFVTGPSNVLFAGVHVYTFQPGNLTGCGSEGIKSQMCLAVQGPQRTISSFQFATFETVEKHCG